MTNTCMFRNKTCMAKTIFSAALVVLSVCGSSQAQEAFPAKLKAQAELPGATFVPAPIGAASYYNISGRFTSGQRSETLYATHQDATSLALPFTGQPLQGFSGIRSLGNDRFLVLTDNGFGNQMNSSDAILMFNIVHVDWNKGVVDIEKTVRLSDPHHKVPFPIMNEASEGRFLTGADFDPESIQPLGKNYWIGDEFGPWIIEVNAEGEVLRTIATRPAGRLIQSPDNAFVKTPNPGGALPETVVSYRSGGFEGMAISEDGKMLYPLLEKPLFDSQAGGKQHINGKAVLSMFEVSTETGEWTDTVRYFPLEADKHAIGDFNLIDGTRGLIIERGSGRGDPREGWPTRPAMFKRIYLIDLNRVDENGVLEKIAYIDLMNIADPDGIAPRGTIEGTYTFPYVTIENVDRVDATTIVVANDNNYPFSVGRQKGRADDNEMILLDVADFLKAGKH